MSSKRTAESVKKAAVAGGQRQFKQTTLNFGRSGSSPASSSPRPPRQPRQGTITTISAAQADGGTSTPAEAGDEEEGSQRVRKARSPIGFDFSKEASKENRAPPPLQPQPQPQSQPEDGTGVQGSSSGDSGNSTGGGGGGLIRITDIQGDLFSAPPNTVLIHACNSIGSWGGGIALAFKKWYPEAFKIYAAHCKRYASDPRKLVGTALLIPPPPPPPSSSSAAAAVATGVPLNTFGKKAASASADRAAEVRKQHYIGCLFTSKAYGRGRDPPQHILRATAPALGELMRAIALERNRSRRNGHSGPGEIRMCHINSGLFDVPWAETKRVVTEMRVEDILEEGSDSDEITRELGDLPVGIEAYWRPEMQGGK